MVETYILNSEQHREERRKRDQEFIRLSRAFAKAVTAHRVAEGLTDVARAKYADLMRQENEAIEARDMAFANLSEHLSKMGRGPSSGLDYPSAEEVRDALSLVMDKPPTIGFIQSLTPGQRHDAMRWVSYVHLEASDNDVNPEPKPAFLEGFE